MPNCACPSEGTRVANLAHDALVALGLASPDDELALGLVCLFSLGCIDLRDGPCKAVDPGGDERAAIFLEDGGRPRGFLGRVGLRPPSSLRGSQAQVWCCLMVVMVVGVAWWRGVLW